MSKAVFLDRDGTINEEMGYINHSTRFRVFNYTYDAIKILNNLGFIVFVITNQSGIARGYFSEELLLELNKILLDRAQKNNAHIEKIYYCPHHKDGTVEKYSIECDCRKPKPGMLLKAQNEYNIDFKASYIIGDRYKDILFGSENNLKTIMVMSGYGLGEYTYQKENWEKMPDYVCENLLDAAQLINKIETSGK